VAAAPADTADAETVEPVADTAGDETAAETAVASDTESVPAAEAEPPAGESAGENNLTEPNPQDSERRLQTPEERLARMESPVNHGSAEGDLDIAAVGPKRPAPRGVRRAQPAVDATTNTSEQTEDVSDVNGEDHRSPGIGTAG
jgi:hypothetical protein